MRTAGFLWILSCACGFSSPDPPSQTSLFSTSRFPACRIHKGSCTCKACTAPTSRQVRGQQTTAMSLSILPKRRFYICHSDRRNYAEKPRRLLLCLVHIGAAFPQVEVYFITAVDSFDLQQGCMLTLVPQAPLVSSEYRLAPQPRRLKNTHPWWSRGS